MDLHPAHDRGRQSGLYALDTANTALASVEMMTLRFLVIRSGWNHTPQQIAIITHPLNRACAAMAITALSK